MINNIINVSGEKKATTNLLSVPGQIVSEGPPAVQQIRGAQWFAGSVVHIAKQHVLRERGETKCLCIYRYTVAHILP